MERSEQINEISKALALFHTVVGKISKDAKNPFFKSNYASLPHILDEIQEPLEKSGLIISQFPDGNGLTTMLIHSDSGQYLQATYIMPVAKANDPQALGSAISYARRYAVSSILSLKIDDDDANRATGHKAPQQEDNRPWLNKVDFDKARDFIANGGDLEAIKKKYRISKEMMDNLTTVINKL
jgi:hypothetical protein